MKAPCFKCEERHSGCHAECEKYLDYQDHCEAVRLARVKEQLVDGYEVGEIVKSIRSSRRNREKKRV